MKFIHVNSRVLDYNDYRRDVATLKRIIAADLQCYFASVGFDRREGGYYNHDLDLLVIVVVKKKGAKVFV